MKRVLIAASCLALIAPAFAEAQYDQPKNEKSQHQIQKPSGGPQGGQQGGGNPRPNFRPAPNYGGPNQPGNPAGGNGQPHYRPTPNYGGPNRPNFPGGNNGPRPGYAGRPNFRPGQGHWGAWNGRHWRAGGWVWPRGYGYRRWWVGGILPGLFLAQTYWFYDYADLGFGPPPYGCEWVRYGPDLLLVELDTGQILDVEYGVFY